MSFFVLIFVADKSYGNTTIYKATFLQMILHMDFIIKIFLSFFFVFCVAKNENPKMSKNGKNRFSKKIMVTKFSTFFWSWDRKNFLWSQRYFFRESFLTILKLDIYKCPFFKFTKNFPEKKQEYEKYEKHWLFKYWNKSYFKTT